MSEQQPTTEETPDPEACQKCGAKVMNMARFGKPDGSRMQLAVICVDCLIAQMGLEWRSAPRNTSHIVVPGAHRTVMQ